jgi:hypothetical protein
MGINCFLSAIGLPRISAQIKKSPKLTAEQYESLAQGIITQLESLSNEDHIAYWKHYYGDDRNDGTCKITEISRNGPNYFFVKYQGRYGEVKNDQFNILLFHKWDIAKLTGVPIDMIDLVLGTNAINQYYHKTLLMGDWVKIF